MFFLKIENFPDEIRNFCDRIHDPQISDQIDAADSKIVLKIQWASTKLGPLGQQSNI